MNNKDLEKLFLMGKDADRQVVLNTYSHEELINEVFKTPIEDASDNPMKFIVSTKFSILSFPKGGSSRIGSILHKNPEICIDNSAFENETPALGRFWDTAVGLDETRNRIEKNFKNLKKGTIISPQQSEFNSVINGTSEKDFIIVIRNPKYKWLSGVLQDLLPNWDSSIQPTIIGFLTDKYPNIQPLLNWKKDQEKLFDVLASNVDVAFDAYYDLVKYFLLGVFAKNKSFSYSHFKLYNETTNKLLSLNPKIDKTKLKILDLDSMDGNIDNVFKQYYGDDVVKKDAQGQNTHRKRYEPLLRALKRFEVEYPVHMSTIRDFVTKDYYYYNLIKQQYGKQIFRK